MEKPHVVRARSRLLGECEEADLLVGEDHIAAMRFIAERYTVFTGSLDGSFSVGRLGGLSLLGGGLQLVGCFLTQGPRFF